MKQKKKDVFKFDFHSIESMCIGVKEEEGDRQIHNKKHRGYSK